MENKRNQIEIDLSLNRRGLLLHKGRLYVHSSADIKLIVMDGLHK